ncbi:hypothetical protein DFH06DRAFT_1315574 [Mycena polygramma]|nr:hypothetical protein DFH06DRAFT_1315574 [Mycena polygramma]
MAVIPDSAGGATVTAAPPAVSTALPSPPPASSDGEPSSVAQSPSPPIQTHACAPWTAGRMFSIVPPCALEATDEEADEQWYCITKGRFIGVTNVHGLEQAAIIRVSGAAHKGYPTQAAAPRAFNLALRHNACEVVVV